MRETIIGLIGVVLGGIIGLLGNFLSSYFQNKIWKKEKHIDRLLNQKQKLEDKYEKYINELYLSIEKDGNFNAELFIEAIYSFPQNVSEAVSENNKIHLEKKKDIKAMRESIWNIITEMKKSLIEIEKQIKEEIDS